MQLNIKGEHLAIGVLSFLLLRQNKFPFEKVAVGICKAFNDEMDRREATRMDRIKKWGLDWQGPPR